jgi:hypothetical protein
MHSFGLSSDPLFIFGSVLAIAGVSFSLSGILDIGIVEQILKKKRRFFLFLLKFIFKVRF